mgnify:FL=1|tara:strand:+ start:20971 stop:21438 length:468 start_codon:yes stop_codon:yes gene_type:complete
MQVESDGYGTIEFEENGDILESQIAILGEDVTIEIEGNKDGVVDAMSRLWRLVHTYQEALEADLADPSASCGVAMYLEHLLEDADKEKLQAMFNGATPTKEQLFSRLVPYGIRINLDERESYFQVDVGIGNNISDYLVCVTLDSQAKIQEVTVES